ncbi:Crp/Fnr family transcriptional regulator [Flavobacterium orientale]|uniref:cAMP-binding protein n=1 Tax=Flavobacterium orientale TaxID=1756020 RepID=A0A917DAE6_9FLAO|nr:Crp/Fnr family transcriptional regulator [Flavobacterium orientale]GGD17856.1 cAMP-binding protein [Flavobacterium orientale]
MNKPLLSHVYQHPLINPQELDRLIAAHYKVTFKKGTVVLEKGEVSKGYLLLESGLMRSFAYDYNGNDTTTDFYSKHEIVIEVLSLFQRIPSQETIHALTDCEGWMLDFDVFQELYHSIPGFSEWGRLWMTNRLFHFKQRSVEMVTISAKDRYLQLIKEKPEVVLHSPLKYIASYLGITDSSFSRIRKEGF